MRETNLEQGEIAIKVSHVYKSFKLPTEPTNSLRRTVVNRLKGIKGYKQYEVLKDISFEVKKGDFFGIVGRNGSGKSTLLKIISNIYKPKSGQVERTGKLVPFIELGVGFNDELTGRENVFLNGAMLGYSSKEMREMYDEIVTFAELAPFMDQKLKNYSSGMQVRLAFSLAIKAKGDILVLDEVLAVGDAAFQAKCATYFREIKKDRQKTIVLVTHDMEAVQRYCTTAIMIKNGEIQSFGSPEFVADEYLKDNFTANNFYEESDNSGLSIDFPTLKVTSSSGEYLTNGQTPVVFEINFEIGVSVAYPIVVDINIRERNSDALLITKRSKEYQSVGRHRLFFQLPIDNFSNLDLQARAYIRGVEYSSNDKEDPSYSGVLAYTNEENSCRIKINKTDGKFPGLLREDDNITGKWIAK